MSASMLIDAFTQRGVRLEPRGERLHVAAPVGVLTDEDRFVLAGNKRALMLELGGQVQCSDCDRLTAETVGMCVRCQEREASFHELGIKLGPKGKPSSRAGGVPPKSPASRRAGVELASDPAPALPTDIDGAE